MSARYRRPRAVTLVDHLVGGGAERTALGLTTGLGSGWDRWICASRETEESIRAPAQRATLDQLRAEQIHFVALGRSTRLAVWQWLPLARLLRREHIDVLHAHMMGSSFWAAIIGRLVGVPVVLAHSHGLLAAPGSVSRLVHREVIGRLCDAVIAPSRWTIDALRAEGIPDSKLVLLPNGVAARGPAREPAELRRDLGVRPGSPVIVSVAMLRREKGHSVLLRAMAEVVAQFPDAVALVVGGESGRSYLPGELELLAHDLRLRGSVRFLGQRGDVADIVAAADIAVTHSREENLPLAVIEYMAAAKPIVATRAGGIPELIEDGRHGSLVPTDDPHALAGAISALLSDPAAARAMGERARERQRREFSLDVAAARLSTIYAELLRATRSRRRRGRYVRELAHLRPPRGARAREARGAGAPHPGARA